MRPLTPTEALFDVRLDGQQLGHFPRNPHAYGPQPARKRKFKRDNTTVERAQAGRLIRRAFA